MIFWRPASVHLAIGRIALRRRVHAASHDRTGDDDGHPRSPRWSRLDANGRPPRLPNSLVSSRKSSRTSRRTPRDHMHAALPAQFSSDIEVKPSSWLATAAQCPRSSPHSGLPRRSQSVSRCSMGFTS